MRIIVRVYYQVGKVIQGEFAMDVAVKTLGLYKEQVLCCYIFVTYRETALLSDDRHSAAANKQRAIYAFAGKMELPELDRKLNMLLANCRSSELAQVVWQSCDNGMVDIFMVKRGICNMGTVSYLAAHSLFPDWHIWTQHRTPALALILSAYQEGCLVSTAS
ncbi:hypothetical protein OROMI_017054 [Orobanche minor]